MANYASALIKTAIAEIGYKEKRTNAQLDDKTANAGGGNWTKYARDFDNKWPNWYNGKKTYVDALKKWASPSPAKLMWTHLKRPGSLTKRPRNGRCRWHWLRRSGY